jgi:hypothetical protein
MCECTGLEERECVCVSECKGVFVCTHVCVCVCVCVCVQDQA